MSCGDELQPAPMKINNAVIAMPGVASGKMILQKIVKELAHQSWQLHPTLWVWHQKTLSYSKRES